MEVSVIETVMICPVRWHMHTSRKTAGVQNEEVRTISLSGLSPRCHQRGLALKLMATPVIKLSGRVSISTLRNKSLEPGLSNNHTSNAILKSAAIIIECQNERGIH